MEETKVQLSQAELDFVSDASLILTKNKIIGKVMVMMEALKTSLSLKALQTNHEILTAVPAKISRGEQYLGLPYVILDFPRISKGEEDICFIRSMFWWGHFFSSTLHVSGRYKDLVNARLPDSFEILKAQGFSLGIHPDPWVHHFEADNYIALVNLEKYRFLDLAGKGSFIKLGQKLPVKEWDQANNFLEENWDFLVGLITQPVK